MDPLQPLSSSTLRPPPLQPGVVLPAGPPINFPVVRPGGGASLTLSSPPPGGLTIGKILFDSKDKPRDDAPPRKRGFNDRPPSAGRDEHSPYERRSSEDRPKKRVRERDQDLDSSDSEDVEAEREREKERFERDERRKRLEDERRAAEERQRREEEERRLEREKLEREALEKMVPTQTIVVKGISTRATEEDVARCLADWGPLPVSSVRIIKDRLTRISRGFAFVEFPSVKAAKKLMEDTKTQKLLLDGRKLHFEYTRPSEKTEEEQQDWVCSGCSSVNFGRRSTCFKCLAVRTSDAKVAEPGAAEASFQKQLDEEKTDNLIVRGLEPDVDEASLHYTYAKFGPIKELKVIRDRNTLVSRGFAFVHYNTIEEAKAALLATNNTRLDKTSSTILRVAFARPQQRQPPPFPGLTAAATLPGVNTLLSATWQPKEFGGKRPESQVVSTWEPKEFGASDEERQAGEKQAAAVVSEPPVTTQTQPQTQPEVQSQTQPQTQPQTVSQTQKMAAVQRGGMESLAAQVQGALLKGTAGAGQEQSEKAAPATGPSAGYVWDEASGYYYDAASGYYYDGHRGLYYNGHTQVWYSFDTATQTYKEVQPDAATSAAPQAASAATSGWTQPQQQQLPAQQPTTTATQPATSSLQQYPQQTQATFPQSQSAYDSQQRQPPSAYGQAPSAYGQTPSAYGPSSRPQNSNRPQFLGSQQNTTNNQFSPSAQQGMQATGLVGYNIQPSAYGQAGWRPQNFPPAQNMQRPQNQPHPQNSQQQYGGLESMGRGGFVLGGPGGVGTEVAAGFGNGGMDRFNNGKMVTEDGYRDRAAERRGLYGGPPPTGKNNRGGESGGYGRQGLGPVDEPPVPFERVDQSRALGDSNVGNRMLRNMGWQEGQGLGRGGGGMVDPIKAERTTERVGLGVEVPKVDPRFEILPGDSYKVQMQKKAQQRFMMEQQRGTF